MWELLGVLIREKDKKKERNKSNGRLPPPLTFHLFFHKSNNDSCYLSFEATILATFLSRSLSPIIPYFVLVLSRNQWSTWQHMIGCITGLFHMINEKLWKTNFGGILTEECHVHMLI